jgi:uncharacterized membrane protein YkvA (DUF1232 family)
MRLALVLVLGAVTALAVVAVSTVVLIVVFGPRDQSAASVARFFPNLLRLLRRLYRDPQVPRSVRRRLWIAIAYNVQPVVNVIPDFVPVLGFADNLVVTAWALRSAVRKAGPAAVVHHWSGTADQLVLLFRVARLGHPATEGSPGAGGVGLPQLPELPELPGAPGASELPGSFGAPGSSLG